MVYFSDGDAGLSCEGMSLARRGDLRNCRRFCLRFVSVTLGDRIRRIPENFMALAYALATMESVTSALLGAP
jgi:hypothetical protein